VSDAQREFVTSPIGEADAAAGFECGTPELDSFFASHALANDRRGIGRTFVLRRSQGESDELPPVLGFYTLSMATLEGAKLPRKLRAHLPKYPLPVALIGRLAVDHRAKGRGLGDRLMGDAFRRILAAAEGIGCFGVIVDAKEQRVEGFYERFGFVALGDAVYPRRMFLELQVLQKAARGG
jgi:GNAT superfamily N-acetyltransferase